MSFLYEDFLTQILKSAQSAAEPDTAGKDKASVLQSAKQLVQNLRDELDGKMNFTAARDNADLSQAHLTNLSELFNFLEFNGIKANGKQLVLNARQWRDNATGKMTDLVQQMGEAGKSYAQYPAQGVAQYYVYRDGIASYLNSLSQDAASNPMLKAIVTRLNTELNSSVPGKTTPPTDVAGNGTTPNVNPQKENGQQQGKQLTQQQIQALMATLPFSLRNVDFDRIDRFLDAVVPMMAGTSQATTISSYVAEIKTLESDFSNKFMNHGDRVFQLGLNPENYQNLLRDKTKQYLPAIDLLVKILDDTRAVFDAFDAQYGENEGFEPYRQLMVGQIGERPTDNSIYFRNVTSLRTLQRAGNIQLRPGVK